MRLSARLNLSLILGVTIVSLGLAYYQTRSEELGLRQELERHAVVLAESLEKSAAPLIEKRSLRELQRLVDRFQNHERLAGVAVYDTKGRPVAITSDLASRLLGSPASVARATEEDNGTGEWLRLGAEPMHVFAQPIKSADGTMIGAPAL